MAEYPMVMVEWLDAAHSTGTFTDGEAKKFDLVSLKSVGFLVGDLEDRVVMAKEWQDGVDFRFLQAIPKGNIVKVTYLVAKELTQAIGITDLAGKVHSYEGLSFWDPELQQWVKSNNTNTGLSVSGGPSDVGYS